MFFLVSCNFCYRDSQKYGVPRPASIQGDEQQKIQYNQMLSGRNLQQPGAVPATSPGTRMMPGAHGVGMMTGVNRGMPAVRAGFPRAGSPGMLNMASTGNMPLKTVQGVPNAMSPAGNSMMRPRDPMQMLRVSFLFSFILLKHLNCLLSCINSCLKALAFYLW